MLKNLKYMKKLIPFWTNLDSIFYSMKNLIKLSIFLFVLSSCKKECPCSNECKPQEQCVNDRCRCKPEYYEINQGTALYCKKKESNLYQSEGICGCLDTNFFFRLIQTEPVFENTWFLLESFNSKATIMGGIKERNSIRDSFYNVRIDCDLDSEGRYGIANGVRYSNSNKWNFTIQWYNKSNSPLNNCNVAFFQ